MFHSRTKNNDRLKTSARARKTARSARRLRVEGMETRLMLSATTPEVTLSPFSTITPTSGEKTLLSAPVAIAPNPSEGGWIVISLTGLDQDGSYQDAGGTFSSYPELGPSLLTTHGTSVAGIPGAFSRTNDDVSSPNYTSAFDNNATNVWWSDSTAIGNTLRPVSFSNYSLTTVEVESTVASTQVQAPDLELNHEGGSIAIGSVITELKQHPAEKSTASHTTDSSLESRQAGRGTSSNLIPGEWGRASIFEVVNGAHSTDDHPALNFERAKLRGDQSKSDLVLPLLVSGESVTRPNADATRSGPKQNRDESQSPESDKASAAALDSEVSTTNDVSALPAESGPSENRLGKTLSSVAGVVEGTNVPAPIGPRGAGSSAVALAMDELGTATKAADSWARSRVTAAVVLVLAMERVAAFNSRDKNRRSSDAEAQAPARKMPIRQRRRAALRLDAR